MNKYFADTYAYIEVLKDNPSYHRFKKSVFLTSQYTVAELAYFFIRQDQEPTAIQVASRISDDVINASLPTLLRAMKLKFLYRQKKLSYTDCIGYALARDLGVKFLTGDKQFKDLPDVEFVR